MITHYQRLGINTNASPETVQHVYDRLLKQYQNNGKEYSEEFENIKLAYETLIDPLARTMYNSAYINAPEGPYTDAEEQMVEGVPIITNLRVNAIYGKVVFMGSVLGLLATLMFNYYMGDTPNQQFNNPVFVPVIINKHDTITKQDTIR